MTSSQKTMQVNRRQFVAGSLATLTALPMVARAGGSFAGTTPDALIVLFMRGGMDGLTLCPRHLEDDLINARPNIAVPKPGIGSPTIDLDGKFAFPIEAFDLLTPWAANDLAVVHAVGSPDPTHSHFEAFVRMEFGIPLQPLGSQTTGWLARHLQDTPAVGNGLLRAINVDARMSQTLAGSPATLPIPDLSDFDLEGDPLTAAQRKLVLAAMHSDEPAPVGPAGLDSIEAIELLKSIDFDAYAAAHGAAYPLTTLGSGMLQTAALLDAAESDTSLAPDAVMLELGGWDAHVAASFATTMTNITELSMALKAFYNDTIGLTRNVTVVVMSEFGRRVQENNSLGVDHGAGNAMLLMGRGINGGLVHSDWPGLVAPDLEARWDYRDILSEVLHLRMGNTNLGNVFPGGYVPTFRGVTV
ncbi:MAG: hypothetical protein ACI9EF_001735 [Pseudohongiellaceae bacterium]|jgi:uncharacterized protein (DUF1501 family)